MGGSEKTLKFRMDGTFKIVQIADLHYEGDQPEDARSIACIETVLDLEQPDLVVFTGDVLKANRCDHPPTRFVEIMALPEQRGIPYAVVLGNHDSEHEDYSREQMMAALEGRPLCYAEAGPEDVSGVGNYVIPLHGSRDGTPQALLYCFDTGCSAPKQIVNGYAWIERDQIDWYTRRSTAYAASYGVPLPALAFFHIPLPEYKELWEQHICYGERNEENGIPKLNSGLFAAMKTMGDVMGTFVGHDHTNNYWGDLHGIRLCYGQTGGFNKVSYGEYPRGARVIQLREGVRDFDTWIRMADGTVQTSQPEHYPTGSIPSTDNREAPRAVRPPYSEQEAMQMLRRNFGTLDWEWRRRQLVGEAIDQPALIHRVPAQLRLVAWSGVNIAELAELGRWWSEQAEAVTATASIAEAAAGYSAPQVSRLAALLSAAYGGGRSAGFVTLACRSEEGMTEGEDMQLAPGRYGLLCRMTVTPDTRPAARVQLQLRLKNERGHVLTVLASEQERLQAHAGREVLLYIVCDIPEQIDGAGVSRAHWAVRLKDCREADVMPQIVAFCHC